MEALPRKKLNYQLTAFAVVGTVGFLFDAGVFLVLSSVLGMDVLLARLCAFLPATGVTWLLNRSTAFRGRRVHATKSREYMKYLLVQSGGIAVNFLTFYVVLKLFLLSSQQPLLPLAVGSIAALLFNFAGAKLFVFAE